MRNLFSFNVSSRMPAIAHHQVHHPRQHMQVGLLGRCWHYLSIQDMPRRRQGWGCAKSDAARPCSYTRDSKHWHTPASCTLEWHVRCTTAVEFHVRRKARQGAPHAPFNFAASTSLPEFKRNSTTLWCQDGTVSSMSPDCWRITQGAWPTLKCCGSFLVCYS